MKKKWNRRYHSKQQVLRAHWWSYNSVSQWSFLSTVVHEFWSFLHTQTKTQNFRKLITMWNLQLFHKFTLSTIIIDKRWKRHRKARCWWKISKHKHSWSIFDELFLLVKTLCGIFALEFTNDIDCFINFKKNPSSCACNFTDYWTHSCSCCRDFNCRWLLLLLSHRLRECVVHKRTGRESVLNLTPLKNLSVCFETCIFWDWNFLLSHLNIFTKTFLSIFLVQMEDRNLIPSTVAQVTERKNYFFLFTELSILCSRDDKRISN